MVLGGGGGSSMAAASQRPMALLAGRMQLSGGRSQVQAQASQQQQQLLLHFQHQGFAIGLRRPGPTASSPGLLLQRKLAPVLAVGDEELEITAVQGGESKFLRCFSAFLHCVAVKVSSLRYQTLGLMQLLGLAELADGSFFFSFGASPPPQVGRGVEDIASARAELVVTPAALRLPQRLPSRFRKQSPIPVLAARRKRGGKKQEESELEAADAGAPSVEVTRSANVGLQPTRPPSAFVKRSPIPEPTQRGKPFSPPSEAGLDDRTSVSSKDVANIDLHVVVPSSQKDAVPSVTLEQVTGKEEEEHVPDAAASVNGRPKLVANTRRRSSRKAAKSDKGESAQSRDSSPASASAQAAPAAVAVHAPVAPPRAPSKFVRRSPIPALSKRSVRAPPEAPPAVAQGPIKETTVVVKESVAKQAVVKKTVQVKETVHQVKETVHQVKEAVQVKEIVQVKDAGQAKEAVQVKETVPVKDAGRAKEAVQVKETVQVKDAGQAKEAVQVKETVQVKDAGQAKEAVQVKETVQVKDAGRAKGAVQGGRTTGRSPAVEAGARQDTVVVASATKTEQTPTRPKSSFVRRSPISGPPVAKVVRAPPVVPAPEVDVRGVEVVESSAGPNPEADVIAVEVVDAVAVSPELKAERRAAPILPKTSASTKSRTKQPPAKPVVMQDAATPAMEAPKAPVLDSDSKFERDDQGVDSSGATTPASLAASTLPELKTIAKARGLKGYSKLKKSELIELLQSGGTS